MTVKRGMFISLEGGEGAGKTTQAGRLAESLNKNGYETLLTREPGGTFGAEAIRNLVLEGASERWSGMTELLLMYAARVDHVEKLIKPALERGVWVISDRFSDSTLAYQGYARGVDMGPIHAVHNAVMDDFMPDMTILFDIDPVLALKRVQTRGEELSRFDSESLDFHKTIRQAFLTIAKDEPKRMKIVDANSSRDEVFTQVLRHVVDTFDGLKFV